MWRLLRCGGNGSSGRHHSHRAAAVGTRREQRRRLLLLGGGGGSGGGGGGPGNAGAAAPIAPIAAARPAAGAAPIGTATTSISSIGFSGAGFLGSYHLGAMDCLVGQGILLAPGEVSPSPGTTTAAAGDGRNRSSEGSGVLLLGASAGSITSAAVSAGVRAEDGMAVVLELAGRARRVGGILDVLRPGFSLIDNVLELMVPAMRDAVGGDEELFLRRIDGGGLLRIALTDRTRLLLPSLAAVDADAGGEDHEEHGEMQTQTPGNTVEVSDAYCYVDEYRDVDDVVAACILSSYIPGLTGPARGASCPVNSAVRRACAKLDELTELGAVKYGSTGRPVAPAPSVRRRSRDGGVDDDSDGGGGAVTAEERFLDGGLSNVWPTADDSTVIVSPIGGSFHPNPAISPRMGDDGSEDENDAAAAASWNLPWHGRSICLDMRNAETLWRMALSSDDATLERRFRNGHDHARAFLKRRGLLKVHKN